MDRYWVGGTGTWNTTNTANWSTTDGGTGGASVPTSADDVYFTPSSGTGTVTISGTVVCQAFITGAFGTTNLGFSASGAAIQVYTFFELDGVSGGFTGNPAVQLLGGLDGNLTSSGSSLGLVTINKTSGSVLVQLGSALTSSGAITVTGGTFTTNNYNVTATTLSSSNINTRTINLGSSTVTLSQVAASHLNFSTPTGLTFNAGTSTIIVTSGTGTFNGGGQTFYNVQYTTAGFSTINVIGQNTFNNLSFVGRTSAGVSIANLSSDQTINGTLTLSAGTNATMRTFVQSNTIGTTRTLTCAAVASLTDIDFRDITIAGAAAPVSGTRLGDCKGNSGITFPAAKTVYWRLTSGADYGTNTGSGGWSLTNGGSTTYAAFPLAQDTAVIGATYPNSGQTISINAAYNIGTIDMSARTSNTMTLATSTQTPSIYGNWINGTGTTLTGTGQMTFAGRGSQTITSAGKTFTQTFAIITPGGSVALQDAFISNRANGANSFFLASGTLNDNGYNFTMSSSAGGIRLDASQTNAQTRTASINGVWSFSGNVDAEPSTNLTVTGTGTINLTSASAKTFDGGGIQTYPTINQGGTGTLTITGSNKFANITNTAIGRVQFTGGTTNEFTAFNLNGVSGNLLQLGSTNTTQATLQKSSDWLMGANSTDGGNNTNLTFSAGGGIDYLSVSYINGTVVAPFISAFIIESATGSSSESTAGTFNPTISELATGSEAGTTTAVLLGTLSESVTIADAIAAARAFYSEVAEATTASDVVSAAATLASIISESAQGQDALVAQAILNSLVADSAVIEDSVTKFVTFVGSVSEIANAASVALSTLSAASYIVESTTSQDSSTVESSTFGASTNETIQAYDSYSPAGSVYNSSFTGAVSLMDSNQGLNTISLAVSENASVADQYAAKFTASTYIIERSVALFGPISVTTIRFDYEAVKDLYSRKRTVYVSRSSLPSERVVIVPAMNRTVYIPRSTVSGERTASAD